MKMIFVHEKSNIIFAFNNGENMGQLIKNEDYPLLSPEFYVDATKPLFDVIIERCLKAISSYIDEIPEGDNYIEVYESLSEEAKSCIIATARLKKVKCHELLQFILCVPCVRNRLETLMSGKILIDYYTKSQAEISLLSQVEKAELNNESKLVLDITKELNKVKKHTESDTTNPADEAFAELVRRSKITIEARGESILREIDE
jgi:hypothetical protein